MAICAFMPNHRTGDGRGRWSEGRSNSGGRNSGSRIMGMWKVKKGSAARPRLGAMRARTHVLMVKV